MKFAKSLVLCASALVVVASNSVAEAARVSWTVDSSQSYLRLNLPDQPVSYEGVTLTARVRNQDSNLTWTDAGGRSANIQGTFETSVLGPANGVGGVVPESIRFLSGQHSLTAIEDKLVRPNPAMWDPETETFTDDSAALAAYGAKLRGSAFVTLDLAFLSISSVAYDIASGVLPIAGGTFGGGSEFGLSEAQANLYGLTALGVEIPSLVDNLDSFAGENILGGVLNPLGDNWYEMVYSIEIPIAIEIEEGVAVTGTAIGQIIATGQIVPEPASIGLAVMGALALAGCVIRRRRA